MIKPSGYSRSREHLFSHPGHIHPKHTAVVGTILMPAKEAAYAAATTQ